MLNGGLKSEVNRYDSPNGELREHAKRALSA
jgi:hypothetical protein